MSPLKPKFPASIIPPPAERTASRPHHKCVGDHGQCGRDIYAKGVCLAHYRRLSRGADIDVPIRDRERNDVQLTPPRVPVLVGQVLDTVCEQAGISQYEFMRRLVMEWFDKYQRTVPGGLKQQDGHRDSRR